MVMIMDYAIKDAIESGLAYGIGGVLVVGFASLSMRLGAATAKPEVAFKGVEDAVSSFWRRIYYYLLLLPEALIVAGVIGMLFGREAGCDRVICATLIQTFLTVLIFHYILSIAGAKPVIDQFAKFISDRGHTEQALTDWKQYRKVGLITRRGNGH